MIKIFSRNSGFLFNSMFVLSSFFATQAHAQNCTLPNNSGQCSGGQGQIAVGGANITNNNNYWSSINRTVTGTVKVNNGGRLTVCSGVLTLNDLDFGGGIIVVLSGATLNIQNAHTMNGAELFNYGTVNYNNNVTLQGNASTRIYNHPGGVINVASPYQMLINNNSQLINAGVVNVHTINLNVNNPNPNAVCMGVNSVLLATNVIDQTSNNNGISGLTNSCVSVGSSYTANNTSSTSDLLVCIDENATGTGTFGQATPTNQCTSCGVLQSAALTFNTTSNLNTICVGESVTITAGASFLPYGMQYQWGTGTVGSNIISGATSSSITVTPNQTTTYWVRVVEIADQNNVSSTSSTKTITVNVPTVNTTLANNDMVWSGRLSNNWTTVDNWLVYNNGLFSTSAQQPGNDRNVIIPSAEQSCVFNSVNIPSTTKNTNNLTIEAGATLSMTGGILRVFGNFTNNGTFTPGTNTFIFRGGANQTVNMNSNSNTFYNLTVDKSNGEVSLSSDIQVTNELTMTARNINLNNRSINLGTTGTIVDEKETSRVYCNCNDGYIRSVATIGSNATVEPGNMGMIFTTTGNQMGTTIVRRRHLQAGANGINGVGENELLGIKRVFDVEPEFNGVDYNDSLNVNVVVKFLSVEAQDIPMNTDISVYRSTDQGNTWDNVAFTSFTSNSISLNGLLGFSWITAGPDDGNYLPIELINFDALSGDNFVDLFWSTASEQDNDFFTVERSVDGFNWDNILSIDGAGNSIHRIDYQARDTRPVAGISYYRLKQTDFDGNFTHSNIVSIVFDTENKTLVDVVNILGQSVDMNTKGLVILIFSNGESVKRINE